MTKECFCVNTQIIYSDHQTTYIDIEWCPECGTVRVYYEDDVQIYRPEWLELEGAYHET